MDCTDGILEAYNDIIKQNDECYRSAAKAVGLPECAFRVLYAIRDSAVPLTQSEIAQNLWLPKQTVNSSLKKMESNGYIRLEGMRDRRSKQARLTDKGIELAKNTVDRVMSAERQALSGLTESEQKEFIRTFRKLTNLLRSNLEEL